MAGHAAPGGPDVSRAFSHGPLDFRAMPPAIRALVVANAVAFLLAQLVGGQFRDLFGLVPLHVTRDRWVWQPFTYLFLHANILHLLFNLFSLWMFALPVEGQWGSREFLKYYFLCGIGAGLLSVAMSPHSQVPVIGASGAVYGLLVAFAMLYPDAVVYLYFFFPIRARDMALLFGVLEFFAGAAGSTPGVARLAHLGGMVIGYLYIRWWWVAKIRAKSFISGFFGPKDAETFRRPRRAGSPRRPEGPGGEPPDPMDEVNRILDKISAHGRESLNSQELELLRRLAEKKGPGGKGLH